MSTERQTQKVIQDIPSEYFPIWGETLGYQRGMPHFLQRSEHSEEGVLVLIGEELTYYRIPRDLTPASSQLGSTEQRELERFLPMTLPLPQNEHEAGDQSQFALWKQISWAFAHSTYDQVCGQPSGEGSSYGMNVPFNADIPQHPASDEDLYFSLTYENSVEQSATEEHQTYNFPLGTASAPNSVQGGPESSYNQPNIHWAI